MEVLQVGHRLGQGGDDVLRQGQGGQVGQAADLGGKSGQPVGVQVDLCQSVEVLDGGRQGGNVAFGQAQPLFLFLFHPCKFFL